MNMYQKGGIQLVPAMDSYHPASDLAQHRNSIISEFQSRPPASAKEAAALPANVARWPPAFRSKARVNDSKAGESVLLFMDGVHFVQAAFLGDLWCFTRIFLRSPSGRKRWNVLGAYNAISGN
jgi:hypothetical protein